VYCLVHFNHLGLVSFRLSGALFVVCAWSRSDPLAFLGDLLLLTSLLWYIQLVWALHYRLDSHLLLCSQRFVCLPQEAARKMMDSTGDNGLLIDGRQIFFEYRYVSSLRRCKLSMWRNVLDCNSRIGLLIIFLNDFWCNCFRSVRISNLVHWQIN
jgi:hypothetical protein